MSACIATIRLDLGDTDLLHMEQTKEVWLEVGGGSPEREGLHEYAVSTDVINTYVKCNVCQQC